MRNLTKCEYGSVNEADRIACKNAFNRDSCIIPK